MTEQEKGVALDMERLDKRLAATGRWSRKEIKDMIRQGRILVNGLPARRPEEMCIRDSVWCACAI